MKRIRKIDKDARKLGHAREDLQEQKKLTSAEIERAIQKASRAIDELRGQLSAVKRIVVIERAQVIYYTDRALAFARRETADLTLRDFKSLTEPEQEKYVKRAVVELHGTDSALDKNSNNQIVQ